MFTSKAVKSRNWLYVQTSFTSFRTRWLGLSWRLTDYLYLRHLFEHSDSYEDWLNTNMFHIYLNTIQEHFFLQLTLLIISLITYLVDYFFVDYSSLTDFFISSRTLSLPVGWACSPCCHVVAHSCILIGSFLNYLICRSAFNLLPLT